LPRARSGFISHRPSPTPIHPRSAPARATRSRSSAPTSWRNFICRSSHPVAAFFHIAFKAAALLLYLFGSFILRLDYVSAFVFCVLLLSFDFWTVKNISGRLLVGLRWWSNTKDDGATEWVFESHPVSHQRRRTWCSSRLPGRISSLIFHLPSVDVAAAPLLHSFFFCAARHAEHSKRASNR
jgi:hypothetical protein